MKRVALFKSTANYWPQAQLAINSFRQWNPNWEVHVMNEGYDTPYRTHWFRDKDWMVTAQYVTMIQLLESFQADQVLIIDSDTYTYGPYVEAEQELETASILVTPHVTKPLPLERGEPSLQQIARMGNYNAGFIGATREGLPFLRFVREWAAAHPVLDDVNYIAGEQGWLRFACDFDEKARVFRHPGYNYAYWNADLKHLESMGHGRWLVDGKPLRMVHFSGLVRGLDPAKLSRYQNRKRWASSTPEYRLYAEYLSKLERL